MSNDNRRSNPALTIALAVAAAAPGKGQEPRTPMRDSAAIAAIEHEWIDKARSAPRLCGAPARVPTMSGNAAGAGPWVAAVTMIAPIMPGGGERGEALPDADYAWENEAKRPERLYRR